MTRRQLTTILICAALALFGAGIAFGLMMGMNWVDRVTFMFCLGVVYLIGSVLLAARFGPSANLPYDEDERDARRSHGGERGS